MRFLVFILLMIVFNSNAFSQKGWGAGACGLYNFNEHSAGLGARVLIPVHPKLWAVPYIYYYFPNHEFSGGISAMVPFYKYDRFLFYGIASGTIRAKVSVSVNDSTATKSSSHKAEGELGAGVLIGNGCLKGMFEPRYAVMNKQIILRAGAVYFFSCGKQKSRSKSSKNRYKSGNYSNVRQRAYCPAYH